MLFNAHGQLIKPEDLDRQPEMVEYNNPSQVMEIDPELMRTATGREVMINQVLQARMALAKDATEAYDALLTSTGGVTLGDADEYGDRPILHQGQETGHVVGEGLAKEKFADDKDWTPDPSDEDL